MLKLEYKDDKGTVYNPVELQKNIWEYSTGGDILKEAFPKHRLVYLTSGKNGGYIFKLTVPSIYGKGRITLTGTFQQY